jgi:hypothetical protein
VILLLHRAEVPVFDLPFVYRLSRWDGERLR